MTLRPDESIAQRLKRIKLVLMDVDGTLITSDSKTFGRVVGQLRRLKTVGVNFSIATGRTIRGIEPIVRQLKETGARLPPMITYNGAVVAVGDKSLVLKVRTFDRSIFAELLRHCRSANISPLVYTCTANPLGMVREVVYAEATNGPVNEVNGAEIVTVEDLLGIEDEVVAALIKSPPGAAGVALIEELTQSFSGLLRITTSGGSYIEICHPMGTKRNGMLELADMLRISADEIMAIGDNFNDLEMIEAAGVGAAVANAPQAVRDAAKFRCSQTGARGVVEILRVLAHVIRTEKAWANALTRAG